MNNDPIDSSEGNDIDLVRLVAQLAVGGNDGDQLYR